MIHIEKGQKFFEDENLVVSTATGDYADNDLIEFYNLDNPNMVAGSFQAQYIKYGNIVYKFNDNQVLGEEILKIDPESTHAAASFVKMNKELSRQMEEGSLEPESLTQVLSDEQTSMEEKMTDSSTTTEQNPVGTVETTTTRMDGDGNIIDSTTTTTTTSKEVPISPDPVIAPAPVDEVPVVVPDIQVNPDDITPTAIDPTVSVIKKKRILI